MERALTVAVAGLLALISCTHQPEAPPPEVQEVAPPPKILQFYAVPGWCQAGEDVTICYGVENAERVAIAPQLRQLTPSRNRCFSVSPQKSAVYKLTATGAGGQASAQLAIHVEAPAKPPSPPPPTAPILELLAASANEVAPGQPVTLCYIATNAASVRVDPPVRELPANSTCFTATLSDTTTFTVTAMDSENREESRQVTVRVR